VIRYALVCAANHTFESWFANSAVYDKQLKRGLIACPVCGSTEVDKAIMAPALGRNTRAAAPEPAAAPAPAAAPVPADSPDKAPVAMLSEHERELRAKLKELRDHIVNNADNVGERFPNEARKMHYGDIEHRPIYGEASPEEARSLIDEGIEVSPLPVLPEDRN
jgi:hypothetical protein